jgi:predicted nucleic acid-binding protein
VGLIDEVGAGPVALDTSPFIFLAEAHPEFAGEVRPLFEAAEAGVLELVTSELTLLEVLVVPYRAGDERLAARYERLLTAGRGLRLIPIGRGELRLAARLRALHELRTPDALQVAAALAARCSAFVTGDRRIPSLDRLRVVQVGARR